MVIYHFMPVGGTTTIPDMSEPFRCLILIGRPTDPATRESISRSIVVAGCRYAMTWGAQCEVWHDTIDEVAQAVAGTADVPDERSILTTWHLGETLEDVAHFAANVATSSFDEQLLNTLLVLDLGAAERRSEVERLFCDLGMELRPAPAAPRDRPAY